MCSKTAIKKSARRRRTLLESMRQFLTPTVWKQGHQACPKRKRNPRWQLQPLVLTLLAMTWCCGDSQAERFETGKAFAAVALTRRRRPGATVEGFHKALAKLPVFVLRALAAGVRRQMARLFADTLWVMGFIPIGVDGSRLECPRSQELERYMGKAGKDKSAPSMWVTALVHLKTGLLWAWKLGKGNASERGHLQQMLPWLPSGALVVADAGFNGFFLARAIVAAQASFLIRMSAKVTLLSDQAVDVEQFEDGELYYWPQDAQEENCPPLRVRLVRVHAKKKKNDVWLLTNVLDPERLSVATAAQFYRWRWENEGLFRTYKRTLSKVKLTSRSLKLVHREAEASLLATQLLLAQGALAVKGKQCSPRKVLLAIRNEIQGGGTGGTNGASRKGRLDFGQRLAKATREQRRRSSPKEKRVWVSQRGPHKPPKPPKILMLTKQQKDRIDHVLEHAA
jgi:hypothetical protein